jgi:hypothetical protein
MEKNVGGCSLLELVELDDREDEPTLYLWSENKLFKLVGCVIRPRPRRKARRPR